MIEILNIDDNQILFTNSFINDKFIYLFLIIYDFDFVISIITNYHYKWNKASLLIIKNINYNLCSLAFLSIIYKYLTKNIIFIYFYILYYSWIEGYQLDVFIFIRIYLFNLHIK